VAWSEADAAERSAPAAVPPVGSGGPPMNAARRGGARFTARAAATS
jgi:hypothetical protein